MFSSIVIALTLMSSALVGTFLGFRNRARLESLERRSARAVSDLSERLKRVEQALALAGATPSPASEAAATSVVAASSTAEPVVTISPTPTLIPTLTPAPPIVYPRHVDLSLPPLEAARVAETIAITGVQAPPAAAPSAQTAAPSVPAPASPPPASRDAASPRSPRAVAPPRPSLPTIDWEGLVGVKLFSWIAGVALVLAAVFFLRYSIDHGWLSPAVRVAIGMVTGVGLLVGCELRFSRNYPVTANALDGAGIAILFSTLFAAHSLWHLLPQPVVFVGMAIVAAVAVVLAIRRDSVFIAMLGLLGGFATPALLSTGEDRPVALFSYLMLLNVGLSWVAWRKKWPMLTWASLVFTTLYQWGWVFRFLDASRLPLAMSIFLVFPAVHFVSCVLGSRRSDERDPFFGRSASAAAAMPAVFSLYLAAVPEYGSQFGLLFSQMLIVAAGLGAVAIALRSELLHVLGAVATLAGFVVWLGVSYESGAWPGSLGFLAAFVGLYLAWPWLARRFGFVPGETGELSTIAAPALLVAFPVLAAIEPAAASPLLPFGSLLPLFGAIAWVAVLRREGLLYLVASLFVLATEVVWSVQSLSPETLYQGLAIYLVFALAFLGVPTAAQRAGNRGEGVRPAWMSLALSAHVFLFYVAVQSGLSLPPWPMLGALAVVDVAIGAAALGARSSLPLLLAVVASQCVLLGWIPVASHAPWPLTAMLAADAVAAFGLAGATVAKRRGVDDDHVANAPACGVLLAQLVTILATSLTTDGLPFAWLLANHVVLTAALLWVSQASRRPKLAVAAVFPAAAASALWILDGRNASLWQQGLLLTSALYAVFVAWPFALGRRGRNQLDPFLAAVAAGVPFVLLARHSMIEGGLQGWVGIVPVVASAATAALLARVLALETAGEREQGRLALLAGGALAFATVAIPMQLDREWITVGWALEAASLAWLWQRIRFAQLPWWVLGLSTAAFVRLALNPDVLSYHPASGMPVWNWYLYTYLVPALAMFASAAWLRGVRDEAFAQIRGRELLAGGASVLLFLLLNIEIADFYSTGRTLTFHFSGDIAQDLTYTIGWGLFAIGLLAAGIAQRSRGVRIAALGLLVTTIAKCFLHDLWRLGGLYRVGSFVGLAVCLALVAVLLQRFVFGGQPEIGEATKEIDEA